YAVDPDRVAFAPKRMLGHRAHHPDQQACDTQIADRFVEKGRVKRREARVLLGSTNRIYLNGPGQVGGSSKRFLIRPVTPAANGLAHRQRRNRDISPGKETLVTPAAIEPKREYA